MAPGPLYDSVEQLSRSQGMPDALDDMVDWFSAHEPMSAVPSLFFDTEPFQTQLEAPCTDTNSNESQYVATQSISRKKTDSPGNLNAIRRHARVPRTLPYPINGVNTASDQRYFAHFVNVTSRVLTICTDRSNPLLTMVLPRSLEDTMIQKAILCLGASHIQSLQPNPEPQLIPGKEALLHAAEDAQIMRLSAQRSQDTQISSSELEAILSCTLLLCLYEISEGTGDLAWRVRFDAAKDLIGTTMSFQSSAESLQVDDFLLEFFMYHDILAAVTDQSRVPILTSQAVASLRSEPSTAYMIGVEDGLLDLVARVAALRSCDSAASTVCDALVIWEDLNNWEPRTEDPDKKLGYSAYVNALFTWIYSILYPSNIRDEKVREAVRAGLEDMEMITDSGILAFLLFPAFVLGFASVTEEERQVCSAQFQKLRKFSGLGNVKLAHDLVKSSWTEYDEGIDNTWDWVDYMARHGISLPVT